MNEWCVYNAVDERESEEGDPFPWYIELHSGSIGFQLSPRFATEVEARKFISEVVMRAVPERVR